MNLNNKPNQSVFRDKIKILLVEQNHQELNEINEKLLALGIFQVVGKTTTHSLVLPLINRNQPDFVLVGVEADDLDTELIEQIHVRFTSTKIIVIGKGLDANTILQYFRAGASEYLDKSINRDEVIKVFTKLFQATHKSLDSSHHSEVIGVWGSSGGCGTTTIASNLAYLLQEIGPTVVVDLNFWQRDLSIFFDLHPHYTLQDVINASKRIDEALLNEMIVKYKNGLSVLALSVDQPLQHLENINLEAIVELLKVNYRYVVLDLGHLDLADHQVLYIVNKVLLVANQILPNLYLALRKLRFLKSINFANEDVCLVVNKYTRNSDITTKHIAKTLEFSNIQTVDEDSKVVYKAINQGSSVIEVKRRSYIGKDLTKLANYLTEYFKNSRNNKSEEIQLQPLAERSQVSTKLLYQG